MTITTYHGRPAGGGDFDFGPISGPLCGSLAALALALAQPFVGFPAALPLIVCAVAALVTGVVGWFRATAYPTIVYRAACWLVAGGWTLWPILGGWSWWNLGALATAALIAGMLASTLAPERQRDPAAAGMSLSITGATARTIEGEWSERVTRIARIEGEGGAQVRHVEHWPNRTGYTLLGDFPAESGYRWTVVRDVAENLAAAKRLPVGCPVVAEVGQHQGGWRLHVATSTEGLTADLPFPLDDLSPTSVKDDFQIGQLLDTRPVKLNTYQAATIVVGERGGGKTVLLHNIAGNVARTRDCVIMMADLNGGGLPAPWVWPWANGKAPRSRVSAVAINDKQALAMAEALDRIVRDRKSRYQHLLIQHNTDVLPPDVGVPEILVIVDEGGEVYGDEATPAARKAATLFRKVQRIGRAMLVNIVLSAQRGTSDYVPTQVKANARNRIAVTVQNDAELAYVFDWDKGLRAADLVTAGCFYVRTSVGESPRQAKGFLLLPQDIAHIATVTADRTPELDAPAVRLGGDWLANVWTNPTTAAWLASLAGKGVDDPGEVVDQDDDDDAPAGGADPFGLPAGVADDVAEIKARLRGVGKPAHTTTEPRPAPAPTPAPPADPHADLPPLPADASAWLDSLDVAEPQRPTRPAAGGQAEAPRVVYTVGDDDDDLAAWWVEVGSQLGEGPRQVLAYIARRDPDDVKTAEVVAAMDGQGISVTRQTVSDWLGKLRGAGLIRSPRQGYWRLGNDQAAGR